MAASGDRYTSGSSTPVIPPGPVPWPFKKATMKVMQAM